MKQRKGRQKDKLKVAKRQRSSVPQEHQRAFDQLLDDAIFGVQPKAKKHP